MDTISITSTVNIESRTGLKGDWSPIDESVKSTEAAKARIDYLRLTAKHNELYRIAQTTKTVYSY